MLGAIAGTAFIGWHAVDFATLRGSTTVEFAVRAWVALLGWLVVVYGVLGVEAGLGDRWHAIRRVERSGRLYRRLGVPVAKRFMPIGDYAVRLIRRLRTGYRLVRDAASADAVLAVVACDVVFDAYPILAQRYNRMRI